MSNTVDIENEVDVLISGAGPVGLSMAHFLSRCNINFKIIEKRTEKIEYSRAFAIHSRTLEIFEQIGIVDKIKKEGRYGPFGAHFYKNGKKIYQIELPPSLSSHPYVVGLLQSETERILDEKLNENGYSVHYGVELENLEKDDESSKFNSAIVKHIKDNKKERIKFKYIIACDGASSSIRKISNIKFTGESVKIHLTCIDAIVESDFSCKPFATLLVDDKDFLGMIWIKPEFVRFVFRKREDEEEISDQGFIQMLNRLTSPTKMIIKKFIWKNTFNINECTCETHFKDNVFLCGDAAHTHSPAGGQGMNTGIQDAYNLAWKLSLILKGVGKEEVLKNNFNEERSMVADMVIKNSGFGIRFAFQESSTINTFIKNLLPFLFSFQYVQDQAIDTISEVGIEYNDNELIKKYSQGWLTNSKVPGVGLRVYDNELINITKSNITSMHKILSGKDKFEIFIHLPECFLKYKGFDKLNTFIKELVSNKRLLNIQSKLKDGLFNFGFILNQYLFNTKQWVHYIQTKVPHVNVEDLKAIQNIFEINSVYLDIKKWGINQYSFSTTLPTLFIIRPDAYIALNCASMNLTPVIEYFKVFIED